MKNEMKTVCVVGCSGFVGSHVTADLLSQGYSVHGTLRNPDKDSSWLMGKVAALAKNGAALTLFEADAADKVALKAAMTGCDGIIMCAGSPESKPETIDLMLALAENVCDAALELGIPKAVFTSSTGSTNPPTGEPELKNEVDHWSDAEVQRSQNKHAAVAKTLLDKTVLERMEKSGDKLQTVTINPSLITGPCFQPEPVSGVKAFHSFITGQRMGDKVPNSSMSMIDVRDLAKLHVAALENPEAKGRYFGVKKSWHWREILGALEKAVPDYKMPALEADEVPIKPTAFDLTRRDSLGVPVRDLDEIVAGTVEELKRRQMI